MILHKNNYFKDQKLLLKNLKIFKDSMNFATYYLNWKKKLSFTFEALAKTKQNILKNCLRGRGRRESGFWLYFTDYLLIFSLSIVHVN